MPAHEAACGSVWQRRGGGADHGNGETLAGSELKIIAAILEQPGNREDPHAPGVSGQGAATLSCPRSSAASGLTIAIHHRSGGLERRATGIGCAQGFSGPMNAARRQGVTRRRYPRKTLFACAINAQQNSATSKDRFKRIGRRVQPCWGCQGKEIGRLKILSSDLVTGQHQAVVKRARRVHRFEITHKLSGPCTLL